MNRSPVSADAARRSVDAFRAWRGAAIWSRGYRPFFLGAALWAIAAVSLWPFVYTGQLDLATAMSPIDWHAHEMIFGYLAAVVAGFLTTAIPNWTGRLPVAGAPLAGLAALWIAGRIATFESARLSRPLGGAIDCAFLALFTLVVAREVVAGRNWRNVKVVALVGLLAAANVAYHVEDASVGYAEYSQRAALALVVMLILLVGGRVTPSFTGNWLAREGTARRPASFDRLDMVAMAVAALALAAWVYAPRSGVAGGLAAIAGLANVARLSRWRGLAARRDALLFVLHAGFGLAASGFLAAAAGAFFPGAVPYDVGVHVWAIGGAGLMTLAMMTRATLGHSGRALAASRATKVAYLLVVLALVLRVGLSIAPGFQTPLLHGAACAWVVAFAAFVWGYWKSLTGNARVPLG